MPGNNDQVCVADADGTVTLLEGGKLEPKRQWDLGGKITAGPYVQGAWVGCVVERRRLAHAGTESAAAARGGQAPIGSA